MASVTLTTDDANVPRIAASIGWTATVDDGTGNQIPNPVPFGQFFKQWVGGLVVNAVALHESQNAAVLAKQAADAAARAAITIS